MNLRLTGGRVPIQTGDLNAPYVLIDFPTREVFDSLYSHHLRAGSRDKYWDVLTRRKGGATLKEAGKPYAMTAERVRQVEAKFIRLMTKLYFESKNSSD